MLVDSVACGVCQQEGCSFFPESSLPQHAHACLAVVLPSLSLHASPALSIALSVYRASDN